VEKILPSQRVGEYDNTMSESNQDLSRRNFLELSGATAAMLASGTVLTSVGRAYPADSDKKIRLAVVGGGFGSQHQWHEHPNCVVTGVTDLLPERRAHLQKTYNWTFAIFQLALVK
jgi:hypothetical protein